MSVNKKIKIALIALVAVCSFASCSNNETVQPDASTEQIETTDMGNTTNETAENTETPVTSSGATKEEIDALASAALEKMSKIPEYPEGYPTLEDVVEQYEKANMAVGWIVNTEKVATDLSDTYEAHGLTYYRVKPDCHYGEHELSHHASELGETEKLIYNKETFEAYLATLIHPDEATNYIIDIKESFDVPKFVENKSGALYALPYSYPVLGYGEEDTYELTDNGDGSYTFTVGYTTLNDDGSVRKENVRKFGYINVDGRWVFENFIVIKQ